MPTDLRSSVVLPQRVRFVAVSRNSWMSAVRPVVVGFSTEVDEVPVEAGRFELPQRAPRTTGIGGSPELTTPDGGYVMEVDATPSDSSGLRSSFPPRAATLGLALARFDGPTRGTSLSRLTTRSRYRRRGDLALAVLPLRWPRTARLELPTFDGILAALAPTYGFTLSDKGHYSRWVIGRVGGLVGFQSLMNDPRSQAIIRAFRSHHRGPGKPSGSYRRFLTLEEMRTTFLAERRAGRSRQAHTQFPAGRRLVARMGRVALSDRDLADRDLDAMRCLSSRVLHRPGFCLRYVRVPALWDGCAGASAATCGLPTRGSRSSLLR